MANRLTIDQDSLVDNDREKQVEFTPTSIARTAILP
jgi:hypothetical protein